MTKKIELVTPAVPLIVVVDGADATGKSTVVDRTVRALKSRGVRVLHHTWLTAPPKMAAETASVYMLNQAFAFDAALSSLASEFDVLICDTHPLISGKNGAESQWQVLQNPDLTLILHADGKELYKRIHGKLPVGAGTALAKLSKKNDWFLSLPKQTTGSSTVFYRDTTHLQHILYASGWLRDWIMTALQK